MTEARAVSLPEDGDVGGPRPLDALRLMNAVGRRRWLLRLLLLAPVALVAWLLFVVAAQAWTPNDSSLWNWADRWAPTGVAVIGIAFGVVLLGLLAARLDPRPEARAAWRLRGRAAAVPAGSDAGALVELLTRRPKLHGVPALVFLGALLMCVATGVAASPAWQGAHGHGGPVYTYGQEATLDHVEHGRSTNYFLSTPSGTAIDEDGRPHDGQRFTVIQDEAWLVGGHAYLLVGALFLVGLLVAVGAVGFEVRSWVTETRRRRTAPHVGTTDVLLALQRSPGRVRLNLAGSGTVVVSADRLRGRDVRRMVLTRRLAGGTAVVVVLAGLGLWWGGVFASPPAEVSRSLPELTGSLGSPDQVGDALIDYRVNDAGALVADVAGVTPRAAWTVTWGRELTYAHVTIYRMADPAAAAAGGRGLLGFDRQAQNQPAAFTGLPTGWDGTLAGQGVLRDAEAFTTQGRLLVEVAAETSPSPGATPADAALAAVGRRVTAAVARYGVPRLAGDTDR